jgi:osmoprotectant transport system permease protein
MNVAWMLDHLDELAARTWQHIVFTAIALLLGFLISFALAVIAVRRRRAYGPIVAVADILFVIPSLAFFAGLVAITGFTIVTVEIPLVLYTLLIFVRNIAEGFDSVPADVLESADGIGYTRMGRLRRVEIPLAIPLMVAGLRLASVSTIGLVTVSAVLGDAFGGLGYFILDGYHRSFPTEIYFGAVPSIALAVIADVVLVRAQRSITPWSRASAGRFA